ncbi:hypothetical protein ATY74_003833 [Vibrio parahaemolyticus]|nr:hypothetical protein [Vibrio parahaemolyticus]
MTILCARESQSIQQMLKAAISQASIVKGFELPEPWYDHGDFTVLCGLVLGFMRQLIVLMDSLKAGLR